MRQARKKNSAGGTCTPPCCTGAYVSHLSNGLSTPSHDGWSALRMFASPAAPNASLVHVTPPRRWSDATFTVDCGWSLPLEQRSCGWEETSTNK